MPLQFPAVVAPPARPQGLVATLATALRGWSSRQWVVTFAVGAAVALLIGFATVLIPNPVFGRDIPPVWWNYPVWILSSILTGMLVATYVRAGDAGTETIEDEPEVRRTSRFGIIGSFLAWFAVGCPVCNKIALLALGYSGAITWFTPIQPFLAIGALAFTGVALVWRLRGQVSCSVSSTPMAVAP